MSTTLHILYEDNHVIAVFKLAGVLVQADDSGDICLMDQVKQHLKDVYHKPGNVFLGLIHRLDRPVAGIVIFGKTSKGASRLSAQFRDRSVSKTYHALVEGELSHHKDVLVHFISKDRDKNKVTVYDHEMMGASRAELSYEVCESGHGVSLVQVVLKTGRPHQIRSQFAHIGHPLVGDVKYGARTSLPDRSIALVASSLAFDTPVGGERVVIALSQSDIRDLLSIAY